MFNKVILIGRTTKDVELRRTASGSPVATFTLAVNRYSRNEENNRTTDFINCVAWNRTAEVMEQYVKKGSLINVEGRIQVRDYENNEGRRIVVTEVVCENMQMLESRNSNNATYGEDYQTKGNDYQKEENKTTENVENTNDEVDFNISEDDLPF